MDRLVEVVDLLRNHCPWTAALDHAELLEYLVEETYELYEALDDVERAQQSSLPAEKLRTDQLHTDQLLDELRGELGDVLFQVVLHSQLQAEQGTFSLAEVVKGLTAKLVRRNPHVFAPDGGLHRSFPASVEQIVTTWQDVKKQERPARISPFDGIPHQLPALAFAAKTLKRAGEVRGGATELTEEAVGQQLLTLVGRALESGVDPERALRRAVLEYQRTYEQQSAGDT